MPHAWLFINLLEFHLDVERLGNGERDRSGATRPNRRTCRCSVTRERSAGILNVEAMFRVIKSPIRNHQT